MDRWHEVAAEFMSRSKSEYCEFDHRVTLASHIKSYLTMHYVGDLSRKKDEHALPSG